MNDGQLPACNCQLLLGAFANDNDLIDATRAARERGFRIVDAYTPYPVHGLDKAMGLKPSRLGIVCFACGIVGVVSAMALQHWTMAIDWPINVGGRPFNSWPAFVPVAFELLVLFAGFGVVFAFLGVSRLFPGKRAANMCHRTSNDQFVLVVEASGEAAHADAVLELFHEHGVIAVKTRDDHAVTAAPAAFSLRPLNLALATLFVAGIALNWTLNSDQCRPNLEFMPEMAHSKAHESYGRHGSLPNKLVLQLPPEGTIPRGHLPLHFKATPRDAERAGEELSNPFKVGDKRWQPRGAVVYANYCALCHGVGGDGDGPVSKRGMPPPPSLLLKKKIKTKEGKEMDVDKFADGQLFHIITFGQGNMAPYAAQISREDRWAAILHLRHLQEAK